VVLAAHAGDNACESLCPCRTAPAHRRRESARKGYGSPIGTDSAPTGVAQDHRRRSGTPSGSERDSVGVRTLWMGNKDHPVFKY
jgi:hypothetical protein